MCGRKKDFLLERGTCSPDLDLYSDQNKQHASFSSIEEEILPTIVQLTENDVLLGRGYSVLTHSGNQAYRRLIELNRETYQDAPRHHRPIIADELINRIRSQSPPGRFLDRFQGHKYVEVPHKKALEKTMQALREKPKSSENYRVALVSHAATAGASQGDLDTRNLFERRQLDYPAFPLKEKSIHQQIGQEEVRLVGETPPNTVFATFHSSLSKSKPYSDTFSTSDSSTRHEEKKSRYVTSSDQRGDSADSISSEQQEATYPDQFHDPEEDATPAQIASLHLCRRSGMI